MRTWHWWPTYPSSNKYARNLLNRVSNRVMRDWPTYCIYKNGSLVANLISRSHKVAASSWKTELLTSSLSSLASLWKSLRKRKIPINQTAPHSRSSQASWKSPLNTQSILKESCLWRRKKRWPQLSTTTLCRWWGMQAQLPKGLETPQSHLKMASVQT